MQVRAASRPGRGLPAAPSVEARWNPRRAWGVVRLVEGRPPTEEDLVSRAQRGDVDAYERIVEAYQGIAFRVAYLLCGDAGEAEEAAQEGLVKAFRALPRFRKGAPLRPWLLQIVANEARNRRRSAGRRASLALRAAAETRPGGAAPSPEAAVLGAEQRAELLAAVNTLREEERLIVACRYFLDLSEAETAAALDLRPGTVKSRLSRALDRLRTALEATHA
jgi:RNA polymerase sigma factor (sigma-70 family)